MDEIPGSRQSPDERIASAQTLVELAQILGASGGHLPSLRTAVFTRAQQIRRRGEGAAIATREWVAEIVVADWGELLRIEEAVAFTGPTDPAALAPLAAHIERRAVRLGTTPSAGDTDTIDLLRP